MKKLTVLIAIVTLYAIPVFSQLTNEVTIPSSEAQSIEIKSEPAQNSDQNSTDEQAADNDTYLIMVVKMREINHEYGTQRFETTEQGIIYISTPVAAKRKPL